MDQFLAEYYGTGAQQNVPFADDDIEKMAQLTLLTKEAAAEGIDLSQFSDDELVAMASDLYGGNGGNGENDLEKEAAAKFEEADFLGRVMAHAMHQESREIEKQATLAETAGKAWQAVKAAPGKAHAATLGALGSKSEKAVMGLGEKQRGADLLRRLGGGEKGGRSSLAWEKGKKRLARAANIATQAGAGLGAAGVVGGAGYGGVKGVQALRDKKSADSAFEQLVIDRANEHLEAAGLLQKEAAGEDFDTIVDRAALELLEANGYPVEWY